MHARRNLSLTHKEYCRELAQPASQPARRAVFFQNSVFCFSVLTIFFVGFNVLFSTDFSHNDYFSDFSNFRISQLFEILQFSESSTIKNIVES